MVTCKTVLALALLATPCLGLAASPKDQGLLNAAQTERTTLEMARFCGATSEQLAVMDSVVAEDLAAMKQMTPGSANALDEAAASGKREATDQFAKLGEGAQASPQCAQAIQLAEATLMEPSAGR